MLGMVDTDLATLTGFFDPPWSHPVAGLTEATRAFMFAMAGYDLRALGRLAEASQAIQAQLEARISLKDWRNATTAAGNLGELCSIIGDLSRALTYAQQGIDLAKQSGNNFHRMNTKGKLATILHKMGRMSEAGILFKEAEKMQKQFDPETRFLYSLGSFLYCDLLLDQGRYTEVQERATYTLEIAKANNWLADIALDQLSLGRAYLLSYRLGCIDDLALAEGYLDQAVTGTREAKTLHHLPQGLLARAGLHRVKYQFEQALDDLDEAMSIAERGGMGLYQADCQLEYARLYLAENNREKARGHWRTAKEVIEQTGYHLRDREVEEIGQALEGA